MKTKLNIRASLSSLIFKITWISNLMDRLLFWRSKVKLGPMFDYPIPEGSTPFDHVSFKEGDVRYMRKDLDSGEIHYYKNHKEIK